MNEIAKAKLKIPILSAFLLYICFPLCLQWLVENSACY